MNHDDPAGSVPGPAVEPATVSVIQADRFCEKCGYNLRTQAVTRDPRTNILLCRCPECGTFHAAGAATDAGRIWLGRLGTTLLLGWVVFLLATAGAALFGMGMLQYGHLEAFTSHHYEQRQEIIDGQQVTVGHPERRIYVPPRGTYRAQGYEREMRWVTGLLVISSLAIGAFTGGLLVVFCWHLPRRKRLWSLLAPLLTGAFVYWIWTFETVDLRGWGFQRIGLHAVLQGVGWVVGMRFGRSLARVALGILLPPRVCHHLAFLWLVDGRRIPHSPPDGVE